MPEAMSEKHYEEKFEFPLWKLIRERAEEKDISYIAACQEVVPEYEKTIRFRDEEFEKEIVQKRAKEMMQLMQAMMQKREAEMQKQKEGTK